MLEFFKKFLFKTNYSIKMNSHLNNHLNLNPNRIKIILNTTWLLIERVFRIGLGFFVTALVARYLGPRDFGLLSYAISLMALFESFINLGLNSVLKKYLLYWPDKTDSLLGTTLFLRFTSAFLIIVMLLLLLPHYYRYTPGLREIIYILSLSLIFKVVDLVDLWYESQVKSKYSTIVKSVAIVSTSILKLILIYIKAPLHYFAWAVTIEAIVCAIGYLYLLKRHKGPLSSWSSWKFDFEILKKLFNECWPLTFASIAVMVYMKIDQIMLKHLADEQAVGIYSVAVKLSEPWGFIAVNIIASFFPTIVLAKKKSIKDYYNKLQKLFSFMTFFALIIAIPITIFAHPLINMIFSSKYASSAPILQVHIWSNLFVFWAVAQDPWDIVEKHTKFVCFKSVLAAILNIGLNFFLIPRYGGFGAAWATLISYSMVGFFLNLLHRKTRKAFVSQFKSLLFWKYLR
ncbi:MAG: flippase [Oligoflexia bacterium]|nr:flippase [Oligoflexia bacterium]